MTFFEVSATIFRKLNVCRESFMYNCIVEVLHGIWSPIVNYRVYPISPEGRRKHDI